MLIMYISKYILLMSDKKNIIKKNFRIIAYIIKMYIYYYFLLHTESHNILHFSKKAPTSQN